MRLQRDHENDSGGLGGFVQGLQPRAAIYRCNRLLRLLPGARLNRYVFIYQPLTGLPASLRAFPARLFTVDDPQLAELWPETSLRADRFGQGARCLVIAAAQRLAAGIWLSDQRYIEDEVRAAYIFDPAFVWDFGLFIHPDFRGTRAFAGLWGAVADHLAQQGKQGSLSRIADYLAASLLPHARMGARSFGEATFLTLGSRQWCWSSGLARRQDHAGDVEFHFDAALL